MDHFRYGLRYGYDFGELTGQVEVDFWSFLLRIDPSFLDENCVNVNIFCFLLAIGSKMLMICIGFVPNFLRFKIDA